MRILVTGGAGYIGSHTVLDLVMNGHSVDVVDSLSNGRREALIRVRQMSGADIPLHQFDVCDTEKLLKLARVSQFDAVIHFAGLKSVSESVKDPLTYYANNVGSTISLLHVMQCKGIHKLVFSSSATVYGKPEKSPVTETAQVGVGLTSPYGRTKFMSEQIIADVVAADPRFEASVLRYFNPFGADPSGFIGEDSRSKPNNLMPYVSRVAAGKYPIVEVFGNDYDTQDGTGVRDYVHVSDLARGHRAALEHSQPGRHTYNLGTGKGTSVLELIDTFGKVVGRKVPFHVEKRRDGDIGECFANVTKAQRELGWEATKSLAEACEDQWRWQSANPRGYGS